MSENEIPAPTEPVADSVEPVAETPPGVGEWKESQITCTVNFQTVGPGTFPVWCIKHKASGGYVRIPTTRGAIIVADKRLATRFDSRLWAQTVKNGMRGCRLVRLKSKAEKEIEAAVKDRMKTSTWVFDRNKEEREKKASAEPAPATP